MATSNNTQRLADIHKQVIAHNVALLFLEEERRAIQQEDTMMAQYYYEMQEINHEDLSAYFTNNQESNYL